MNNFCPACGDTRKTLETIGRGKHWHLRVCRACGSAYKFAKLRRKYKELVDRYFERNPLLRDEELC